MLLRIGSRLVALIKGEPKDEPKFPPFQVGRHSYGWHHINVMDWGEGAKLTLGSFCSVAGNVTVLLGGNHRADWITTFPFGRVATGAFGEYELEGISSTNGDVVIGNDVWIGSGATIMSGVTIGHGAIVAANSHVVRDVASYEIVGGNPAKHIRFRFSPEVISALLKLAWWEMPDSRITSIRGKLTLPPTLEAIEKLREDLER